MEYKFNSVEDASNRFLEIKSIAKEYFQNISVEVLNRKPGADKWSAAECLEHLNITSRGYLQNIPKEIAAGTNTEVKIGEYKPRLLIRKFAELSGPDSKIKISSPKILIAESSNLTNSVVEDFIKNQDKFISIINRVNMNLLREIKVTWPVMKFVKLQLGEVLIMTIAHQLRHLNQAKRAIKE